MSKLASFPLQAAGFAGAPDEQTIVGFPDWSLTVGDVRAARRLAHPDVRALLLELLSFEGKLVQGDALAHKAEAILRATMGNCDAGAVPLPPVTLATGEYLNMRRAREAEYGLSPNNPHGGGRALEAFTRGWRAKAEAMDRAGEVTQ